MKRVLIIMGILAAIFVIAEDAQSILNNMNEMYSGFENEINNLKMEQTMQIVEENNEVNMDMVMHKKGNKMRLDVTIDMGNQGEMQGIKTVVIDDGEDMWTIVPFAGKQKMEREKKEQYGAVSEFFWWNNLGSNPTLTGTEKVNGSDAWVIEFDEIKDDQFDKIWVDKEHNYLVRSESYDDDETVTINYSDYRDVHEGRMIPFLTKITTNDDANIIMTVNSIDLEADIDEGMFDPDNVKMDNSGMQDMMKNMMNGKGQ
ncbi:MAG: outer membrane lipoprotein-sorting protein [bacterium]